MLVFDGSHLLHRVMHISTDKGNWQFFSFVFLRSMVKVMAGLKDKEMIVCWDKNGSERRKRLYPEYKLRAPIDDTTDAGKLTKKALETYDTAREWLHENLNRFNALSIMIPGIEADDIAYCLTNKFNIGKGWMVTDDRDWFQSINENWSVFRPINEQYITLANLGNDILGMDYKWKFILEKSMQGDTSDNIRGFKGVGGVGIYKILKWQFGGDNISEADYAKWCTVLDEHSRLIRNVELISYHQILPSEIKRIEEAYANSKKKILLVPDIAACIVFSQELSSANIIDFFNYYQFN